MTYTTPSYYYGGSNGAAPYAGPTTTPSYMYGGQSAAPVALPAVGETSLMQRIRQLMSAKPSPGAPTMSFRDAFKTASAMEGVPISEKIGAFTRGALPRVGYSAGGLAAQVGGAALVNQLPISNTQKQFAMQVPVQAGNAMYIMGRGLPKSTALATAGVGLGLGAAGLGLQLADPKDTAGVDPHDVGQGLSTAAIVGPLAIAFGASNPVGWGIAGAAGLVAAANSFGMFDKETKKYDIGFAQIDLKHALMDQGLDGETATTQAKAVTSDVFKALLETYRQQTGDEKATEIPREAGQQLMTGALQQLGITPQAGLTTTLADALGIDVPSKAKGAEDILAGVYDTVSKYQRGYAAELQPRLEMVDQLRNTLQQMPIPSNVPPEYQALMKANQQVMMAQLQMQQQEAQSQAYQAPLQMAQDFMFGYNQQQANQAGSSSSGFDINSMMAGLQGQ